MAAFDTHIRVYLEGIQIPFNTISVSAAADSYSTCVIDFPPVAEFLGILPRTHVQVFFKDFYDISSDFETYMRLVWEGEVRARTYAKTPEGRAFRLECIDTSGHWSYAYHFFQPGLTQGFDRALAVASGADTQGTEALIAKRDGTESFSTRAYRLLSDKAGAGIASVVELYLEEALQLNAHLRDSNRRLKMMPYSDSTGSSTKQRFKVLEDPEAFALFKAQRLDELMTYAIRNVSARTELRAVVNRLLDFFFYKAWPVIAPPFHAGNGDVGDVLMQTVMKPYTYFSAPLASNVIWPDNYTHLEHRQDFLSEPTRMRLHTLPGGDVTQGLLDKTISERRLDTFAPPLLARAVQGSDQAMVTQTSSGGDILSGPAGSVQTKGSKPADPAEPEPVAVPTIPASVVPFILDDGLLDDDLLKRKGAHTSVPYVVVMKDGVPDESREDRKGIIPGEAALRSYAWLSQIEDKGTIYANYMQRLASYYLALAQHERPTSVSGPWNPYVVAGFPGVVLDRTLPIFGEFGAVNHMVSADGTGSTTIQLNYARFEDAVRYVHVDDLLDSSGNLKDPADFSDKSSATPERDVPVWLNAAYRQEFAGESTFRYKSVTVDDDGKALISSGLGASREGAYPALFGRGVRSIFQDLPDPNKPASLTTPAEIKYSQQEAAQILLRMYEARKPGEGRKRLIQGFQSRPIATMGEALDYIGGRRVNDTEFASVASGSSAPYRAEYQAAAREVRKALVSSFRKGAAI